MQAANIALGVIGILVVWTALKAASIAAAIWFEVSFPRRAEAMYTLYHEKKGRCFFVGLVNVALGVFLVLVLLNLEAFAILGLLLGGILFSCAVLSYGPGYKSFAHKLYPEENTHSIRQRILRGGTILELLFMVPVLGQFVSLGYLFRGFGALSLTTFQRRWKIVVEERS